MHGEPVEDDPHLTVSVKNPATAKKNKHQTAHGYTAHAKSYDVVSVQTNGFRKDDSEKDWPAHMATKPRDVVRGEPRPLAPQAGPSTQPSKSSKPAKRGGR